MKPVEQKVVESLDGGGNMAIYPYLPYLLQDLWEMGSDPELILSLIRRSFDPPLRILDLGCGKGAVAIRLARELDCHVTGVDAMPGFIAEANDYASRFEVERKVSFQVGDIRQFHLEPARWDVIILGAIGEALGGLQKGLLHLLPALGEQGGIILDDAFIEQEVQTDYKRALRREEFFNQIDQAGFRVVHQVLEPAEKPTESSLLFLNLIGRRVDELVRREPAHEPIFRAYLQSQEYETNRLKDTLVCGVWVLKPIREA